QRLTESLPIAFLGGALGLLLALWGTELITSLGREFIPSLSRVEIELPALVFTLAVSVCAGILFGLAPATQLSRPDLNEGLKEGGRIAGGSTGQRRLRNGLIVGGGALGGGFCGFPRVLFPRSLPFLPRSPPFMTPRA